MNIFQISLVIFDIILFSVFLLGFNYLGYLITFKQDNYSRLIKIINIIVFVLFDILILALIFYTFLNF
jgi:hypothetical protein